MKHALVTTTINVPVLLADYCKDFIKHKIKNVEIIVVGDKKTPPEAAEFCKSLQEESAIKTTYMSPEDQIAFLPKEYADFLPWNCIQRRNVGLLKAYANGAEIIYTIDDDNFLHTENYIGHHYQVGIDGSRLWTKKSSTGWHNVCAFAIEKFGNGFFHRGFSFKKRAENAIINGEYKHGRVVVNAGLWLGDPDVDAVTRMAIAPDVEGYEQAYEVLDIGTKSPFNSQNTALHRDVIPAYCMAAKIGRYDDIIASYIVKRIADHLGEFISFGLPLVKQVRNEHDLFKDFEAERVGMQIVDDFVEELYKIELKENNYKDCVEEVVYGLEGWFARRVEAMQGQTLTEKDIFLSNVIENYKQWSKAIAAISA